MANANTRLTTRNTWLSTLNTDLAANCQIKVYTGTQPASPDNAIGTQQLLATLTGNSGGFGIVSGGVLTANAITSGTAVAGGTATWARLLKADGTTVIIDLDVGTTTAFDIRLNTTTIAAGGAVSISSLTIAAQ